MDTSVLVALALGEQGWEQMQVAVAQGPCFIPATVLTELQLVTQTREPFIATNARDLVSELIKNGAEIVAFEGRHADITDVARQRYGKGNGTGGLLNFGDLMVYAVAKDRGEPLLFTGRDFAATDVLIHPSSRVDP